MTGSCGVWGRRATPKREAALSADRRGLRSNPVPRLARCHQVSSIHLTSKGEYLESVDVT
jgi:hypothetical protein